MSVALCVLLALAVAAGCAADVREVKMESATILKTNRNEKVYVAVRNSSSAQNFPIESVIRNRLERDGYTLVNTREEADIKLDVLVHFVGLEHEAWEADKMVGGGLLGAGAGAAVGYAGGGGGKGAALGALIGAAVGVGAGALAEKESHKDSFVGVVAFEVEQKGKETVRNKVVSKVKQKDLTIEKAVGLIADDVGNQIAGLF